MQASTEEKTGELVEVSVTAVSELCAQLGIEILPTCQRRKDPNQTHAGATLRRLVEDYGEGHATLVIRTVTETEAMRVP